MTKRSDGPTERSARAPKNGNGHNLDHLTWLVKWRSHNQKTSLNLYAALEAHSDKITQNADLTTCGISLVAVSFSLWRGVFLADRSGHDEDRFDHAKAFLGALIGDNAISYTQDKNSREWTFNYYINNARHRLRGISGRHPTVLPNYEDPAGLTARRTWEHFQTNLDIAVNNYVDAL